MLLLRNIVGWGKLHIGHVIKVLMSSIVSFYQGLALVQVSTPFYKS